MSLTITSRPTCCRHDPETAMHLTNVRALIDHNQRRVALDLRTLLPFGGEFKSVVDRLASRSVLNLLWPSVLSREIHVSPMSGAWLRVFETEQPKHIPDI